MIFLLACFWECCGDVSFLGGHGGGLAVALFGQVVAALVIIERVVDFGDFPAASLLSQENQDAQLRLLVAALPSLFDETRRPQESGRNPWHSAWTAALFRPIRPPSLHTWRSYRCCVPGRGWSRTSRRLIY